MKMGEEKEVKLTPDQAYGEIQEKRMKKMPHNQLPIKPKPEVGMAMMLSTPDGKQFPAKIAKVEDDGVTIDLNHPLAGKNLTFKLKLVE